MNDHRLKENFVVIVVVVEKLIRKICLETIVSNFILAYIK